MGIIKCWKCGEKNIYLEGINIGIVVYGEDDWRYFSQYLCRVCVEDARTYNGKMRKGFK